MPISRTPRGKLYNTYTKLKKFIKNQSETPATLPSVPAEKSTESVEKLNKLRTITPDSPDLVTLWSETYGIRDSGISIDDYLNTYPVLKTSVGVQLV